MRLDEVYTVKEFLQLNEEKTQKNEFEPKFGNGAKRGSNDNEKAVKEILKNAQAFDEKGRTGKLKRNPEVEFEDYNKTTMDVNFEYEPGKEYKDRVKKLATVGTESDMADYYDVEGNKNFYNQRKEMSKDRNKRDKMEREKGLVGREKKNDVDYSNKTAFVNENNAYTSGEITPRVNNANNRAQFTTPKANPEPGEGNRYIDDGTEDSHEERSTIKECVKPMKRLKFKNTVFLSESQVLKRVPEDYRVDENKFYMQDKTGTDYLVECKADPFGFVHMEVTNKLNKEKINEELEKIKRLSGYKYSDDNIKIDKTQIGDISESINNFRQILNK